jgi:hypothetical protein
LNQLEKNIKKIHTSYLKDGKVTITLSTPMVNVFVRNVAEERLRPFVALLQHVQRRPHDGTSGCLEEDFRLVFQRRHLLLNMIYHLFTK